MPIHRLDREARRAAAVLADITCDSDGKIEHFIDKREVKDVLELHPLNDDDYYLGIFLVGAYQEILGDLHNLFGDTHAVQVSLAPDGGYLIDHVVDGRHGHRGAELRQLQQGRPGREDARASPRAALRNGQHHARRVAPAAAHVRGRPRRLHVPRARGGRPGGGMSLAPLRLVEKVEPGRSSTGT